MQLCVVILRANCGAAKRKWYGGGSATYVTSRAAPNMMSVLRPVATCVRVDPQHLHAADRTAHPQALLLPYQLPAPKKTTTAVSTASQPDPAYQAAAVQTVAPAERPQQAAVRLAHVSRRALLLCYACHTGAGDVRTAQMPVPELCTQPAINRLTRTERHWHLSIWACEMRPDASVPLEGTRGGRIADAVDGGAGATAANGARAAGLPRDLPHQRSAHGRHQRPGAH